MEGELAALVATLVVIVWAILNRPTDDGPEDHKNRSR
jgi:hypothetical protein